MSDSDPDHRGAGRIASWEWSAVRRPAPGESACGDSWVVTRAGDQLLIAGIDGLGHGVTASRASQLAADVLCENAGASVDDLLRLCHRRLHVTRGAAVTIVAVSLPDGPLSWLGVGNVNATLIRTRSDGQQARWSAMLKGGILGHQLPSALPVGTKEIRRGDLVVLATDGISAGFADRPLPVHGVAEITELALSQYAVRVDDAMVLAARWR
jgi:hypothetical protein